MLLVIEIQKTSETEVLNIVTTHATRNEAESKFHLILASAATSNVLKHSAVLMMDDGTVLKKESFLHETPTI